MIPLVTAEAVLIESMRLGTLVLIAGAVTLAIAAMYRWYVQEELPQGIGILFGATAIALVLNTTASLGQSVGGTTDLLDPQAAAFTVLSFLLGALASEIGRYAGDRVGERFVPGWSVGGLDRDVASFISGGGRTIRLTLPDEIHDIDGYDPVRSDVKADLAGSTLTFPGRLTHQELHESFAARLQSDLGIGKVDVEFTEDGEIAYLAVGRGQAGIGHTLPPGQVAVAIRADPAYSASPGDQVGVWVTDPEPDRLLVGELRGIAGDVATLAVDEDLVHRLTAEGGYRLVTHPRAMQADREFASILRRSNEGVVETLVALEADAVGRAAAAFDIDVLVVETADGSVVAPPPRGREFTAGDHVIAMGRPDALRLFTAAAQGTSP